MVDAFWVFAVPGAADRWVNLDSFRVRSLRLESSLALSLARVLKCFAA